MPLPRWMYCISHLSLVLGGLVTLYMLNRRVFASSASVLCTCYMLPASVVPHLLATLTWYQVVPLIVCCPTTRAMQCSVSCDCESSVMLADLVDAYALLADADRTVV